MFIHNALHPRTSTSLDVGSNLSASSINAWYLASSFSSPEAFKTFDRLLHPTYPSVCRVWGAEVEGELDEGHLIQKYELASQPFGSQYNLQQLSDVVDVTGGLTDSDLACTLDITFIAVSTRRQGFESD